MAQSGNSSNDLLATLAASDLAALRPHLKTIELPQGIILFEIGAPIKQVYWPHAGVISLVVALTSGEMIECAMVGRESLVGSAAALGGHISLSKAIAQIPGSASVIDAERLRSVVDGNPALAAVLFRHEQVIQLQALQSAACNASHTVEARLSRWLLRSRDLQGSDDLPLTQEFLAQMLGVRRTSVSVVANTLQQSGLIRYRRWNIRILDAKGLRDMACECYETVRSLAGRLLNDRSSD